MFRTKRRAKISAFTLIELTLVLLTITVLAAMAVPRYSSSLAQYRAQCAAQRIVADLTLAASDARARSAARSVSFTPANHSYTLQNLSDMDATASPWTVRLAEHPYRCSIVSVDLGGDALIVFDGFGKPDSGGSIIVQSGDFKRTILVNGVSGRASIQ